jgi:hypothetical protein
MFVYILCALRPAQFDNTNTYQSRDNITDSTLIQNWESNIERTQNIFIPRTPTSRPIFDAPQILCLLLNMTRPKLARTLSLARSFFHWILKKTCDKGARSITQTSDVDVYSPPSEPYGIGGGDKERYPQFK